MAHISNLLLIAGARLFGEPSQYANDVTCYYWKFDDPSGLTTTQVFMRSQPLLKTQKVELYYRRRWNLTGDVQGFGEYGGEPISYILDESRRGGGNEAATHNAQPQKDSP